MIAITNGMSAECVHGANAPRTSEPTTGTAWATQMAITIDGAVGIPTDFTIGGAAGIPNNR
jgi:hypothetical protein